MKRIIIEISEEQLLEGCDEIVIKLQHPKEQKQDNLMCLENYMQALINDWEERGHHRTAGTYQSALNSFRAFRHQQATLLGDIDKLLIEDYEKHLQQRGITPNSTSFYMRILRATYNRAVDDGLIEDQRPFRHVYTGVAKTGKRAVSIETIRAICHYRSKRKSLMFARDLFLFSFYTRGMSFIDIAHLQASDIADGFLTYRRQKTGALLKIKWEPQMQDIVDRQTVSTTGRLFPILSGQTAIEQKRRVHACQRRINNNLKRIAAELGLETNLTMYVARHSWASIARQLKVPISVISDGMGHNSEKTTRIYLKSMDSSPIDDANHFIIRAIGN